MTTFDVKKLSCGHCVRTVTDAIQSLDPKAVVDVDLTARRVHIRSSASDAQLRDALAAVDYPAA